MEILQLKYFCDAAETENFSRTAAKFDVPPSNISQCIKRLEKELGTKLFARTKNSVVLSEDGEMFYNKVKQALLILKEAEAQIKSPKNEQLSVCVLTNRQLLMEATERFRMLYPDVTVIISHNYDEKNKYDIIVSDSDFPHRQKNRQLILSEKISLAMTKQNPLAKKSEITADDLRKENFISLNKGSSLAETTQKICEKIGIEPRIVIQSPDPFYMRKCIELSLGIAFVPTISWNGLFNDDVVIRDFGDYSRQTYAYIDEACGKKSAENLMKIIKQLC